MEDSRTKEEIARMYRLREILSTVSVSLWQTDHRVLRRLIF
jgi:hypothetical protein